MGLTAMASVLSCGRSEKKSRRMVSVSGGEKSVMPRNIVLNLAGVNEAYSTPTVKKKNRRTFAIRRRFLRVLGNAAIIALSVIGVNSVHSEKRAAGWTFIRR